jgi:hypothetical protein
MNSLSHAQPLSASAAVASSAGEIVAAAAARGRAQYLCARAGDAIRRSAFASNALQDGADGDGDGRRDGRTKRDSLWASAHVYASRTVPGTRAGDWTVRELDARGIPGGAAARCLVFENDAMVRRLWVFPPNWRELPDRRLIDLIDLIDGDDQA